MVFSKNFSASLLIAVALWLAAAAPVNAAKVIVGYGDSITRGFPYRLVDLFGLREGGYIPTLEQLMRTRRPNDDWQVHNWGFGRMNSQQATGRINEAIASPRPDWVLVMIGTNDLFDGISSASMKENVRFIISRIRAVGAEPALATVTPSTYPGQGGSAIPALINPKIIALSQEVNVPLNDAYSFFLPIWPQVNLDGLHPDAQGYALLGQTWCNTIPVCRVQSGVPGGLPFLEMLLE